MVVIVIDRTGRPAMDGRQAREVTLPPAALPRIRRRPAAELPRWLAVVVGAGWPALMVMALAFAPAAADPDAVPTLLDSVVSLAVLAGMAGTIASAVGRRPQALLWSAGLGLVWVATTITCPLSGHHDTVGWQWYTDLAASSTLLLVSLVGARRLRAI
jgi:hypothetical protein